MSHLYAATDDLSLPKGTVSLFVFERVASPRSHFDVEPRNSVLPRAAARATARLIGPH